MAALDAPGVEPTAWALDALRDAIHEVCERRRVAFGSAALELSGALSDEDRRAASALGGIILDEAPRYERRLHPRALTMHPDGTVSVELQSVRPINFVSATFTVRGPAAEEDE